MKGRRQASTFVPTQAYIRVTLLAAGITANLGSENAWTHHTSDNIQALRQIHRRRV